MKTDEQWMKFAINLAIKAESEGEVPVGAVIVKEGKHIADGYNQPISLNDPTAHAEIQAIRKAGKKLNNYRMVGTTIYVTLEPCVMCLGAIKHARIDRIVFGAYDFNSEVYSTLTDLKNKKRYGPNIAITGGILENKCQHLLHSFFKLRRR